MNRLMKIQFYYFRQLIQKRFLYLIGVIVGAQIILAIQMKGNPYGSVLQSFFGGISFEMIRSQRIQIPVFWFCYFVILLFIISDVMQKLWNEHLVQLKGLRFSQLQFGVINLLFLYFTTVIYVIITFLTFCVCNKIIRGADDWLDVPGIDHLYIFILIVFGTALLLVLIQGICALFNPVLGIILPITILLITIYSTFKWNIFNLSMLTRLPHYTYDSSIYLFVGILVTSIIYLQLYRKKSL